MNSLSKNRVARLLELLDHELMNVHERGNNARTGFDFTDHDLTRAALVGVEKDLLRWGKKYLSEHFTREPSVMHRWLGARLDARRERGWKLNILAPRGGAKSTLATLAYVLRCAVTASEPYIWIVSDTKHQAAAHLDNIRAELMDNPRLARDYPEAVGVGPVWRGNLLQLRNGVTIEAVGTGQRIRGRRRRAFRPTLIICDDIQSDRHAESAEQRELSRRWFNALLMKAGSKRTNIVNLATALHRDAIGCQLDATAGWESRIFPAILEWPKRMDLWQEWEGVYREELKCDEQDAEKGRHGDTERNAMTNAAARMTNQLAPHSSFITHNSSLASLSASPHPRVSASRNFYTTYRSLMDDGATLLWPEEEDLYTLMCQRAESGRAAFDREKQNIPGGLESNEWPAEYFGDDVWFHEWPQRLRVRAIGLDPSKGRDAHSGDYSSIVMLGIDEHGTVFVEADLARRPVEKLVTDTVAWHRAFKPDVLAVEANQFQELLASELRRTLSREGILRTSIMPLENHESKLVRIRRWGPLLAQGRVRFKSHSAGTRMMVDQFLDFPNGSHDDGPDGAEMALRVACEWLE